MQCMRQSRARVIPRQRHAETLNGHYRCSRSNASATAASLRQQQQQLTLQLAGVLQQQREQQADKVTEAAQLVHQGVAALLASPDWLQLQQTFQLAARQHNSAAAAPPPPPAGTEKVNAASAFSSGTNSSTSRPAGSSPWGFALRQSKQQPAQQPVQSSPTSSIAPRAANVSPQQQQQQQKVQWDWAGVRQFMMLGQGSLGKLCAGSCSSTTSTLQQPPPRLGFRFFQLVMAVALKQALLQNLTTRPTAYDPDYDQFDQALLDELGFRALEEEPAYDVAGSGAALLYMPCCPRELYATVLAANNGHLQQLAIFGTSMRSLADTQALVAALTAEPPPATTAVTDTQNDVLASGTKHSSSSSSSSRLAQQADVLQLAYQRGCVLEVPSPDCAAHGVGVAVHLFSRGQL